MMVGSFIMLGCSDVEFASTVPLSKLDDNTDGVLSEAEITDSEPRGDVTPPVVVTPPTVTTPVVGGTDEPGLNVDDDVPGEIDDVYSCGNKPDKKVLVCHVPPGNAAAKHTICIGRPALQAHYAHHAHDGSDQDYLGECVANDGLDENVDENIDDEE